MLILSRSCILGVTQNKKQVNKKLSDALLGPSSYKQATRQGHTMKIVGVEDYPIEITNGVKINRRDINMAHEEADLIIAQQVIMLSKEDHTVSVISDDTDVFVLLL